ncbi:MAG TPA: hypothetical protein VLA36_04225 [Longimicrobiales bacterium]|nr:hypothetical protein [Longimicrobiales bacterium]
MFARTLRIAAVLLALTAHSAAAQESIQGVWVIAEAWGQDGQGAAWTNDSPQPSLFIFQDGYYSIAYVSGDAPRPLMPENAARTDLDADQAASVWLPYTSNSGTYEINGAELTTRPMVALWPNFMTGGWATFTMSFEGGMLVLRDGEVWGARLRRLN